MNRKIILGVLLLAVLVPIVASYYGVPNVPITVVNNDDANQHKYNVLLTAYAKTGTTCKDTDKGMKFFEDGNTSLVDQDDNSSYNIADFCQDSNTLVEIGCVEDFTIDGKQNKHLAIAVNVNCLDPSVGKTGCGYKDSNHTQVCK